MSTSRKINQSLRNRQRIFKKDKCCVMCGQLLERRDMTVDHIIPKTCYEDWFDTKNWQVLCQKCHYRKSRSETIIMHGHGDRLPKEDFEEIPRLKEFYNIFKKEQNISPEATR